VVKSTPTRGSRTAIRAFLVCALAALPLGCWSSRPSQPNVLIVVVDTLRADHVGVVKVGTQGKRSHSRSERW
jgi:hypothetical protein